jgi:hypothetical protein
VGPEKSQNSWNVDKKSRKVSMRLNLPLLALKMTEEPTIHGMWAASRNWHFHQTT